MRTAKSTFSRPSAVGSNSDRSFDGPPRFRPKLSPQAAREVKRDTPLRRARTCYRHLAGVAGVYLMDQILSRGWLEETTPRPEDRHVGYTLTASGLQALDRRSVKLMTSTRTRPRGGYGCLDWTERRQHLGGQLGLAIAETLRSDGYISQTCGSREVELLQELGHWLDGSDIKR